MICYARLFANSNSEEILNSFLLTGADREYIFLDPSIHQKKEGSIYLLTKELILQEEKTFVIDSLKSLGKNNREIAKELAWISQNNISFRVLNLPSTYNEMAPPLQVLLENYEHLANLEKQNVKENQKIGIEKAKTEKRLVGRKKIPYPPNWVDNYVLWVNGEISSDQFRDNVSLKKGTFYNLLKQYKTEMKQQKERLIV